MSSKRKVTSLPICQWACTRWCWPQEEFALFPPHRTLSTDEGDSLRLFSCICGKDFLCYFVSSTTLLYASEHSIYITSAPFKFVITGYRKQNPGFRAWYTMVAGSWHLRFDFCKFFSFCSFCKISLHMLTLATMFVNFLANRDKMTLSYS